MIIDFDEYFKHYEYEPIDLCACYEPTDEPPADLVAEWHREHEPQNPFSCQVMRKIGSTLYIIETECDGSEPLPSMVKRLIFSEKGAVS